MKNDQIKKYIERKWVLLDTNVLLRAARQPEKFLELFNFLRDAGCKPAYCQLVRAEFMQSVWQPELIQAQEVFLTDLNIEMLPMAVDELTDDVVKMTRALRSRGRALPGLVDSYLTALVKKYSPNLVLLTENHKHFAYNLKRFAVWPLDLSEQDIVCLAFYAG